MNSVVKFQPDAETDIEEVADWYEGQSKGLGVEFLDEVLSTCDLMSKNPKMFPIVRHEIRRAIIKRFPFGIYYKTEASFVSIIAVMHASRNPIARKNRS